MTRPGTIPNDPPFPDSPTVGRNVAALVEAGLPLEAGLKALSEEMPVGRTKHILKRMSRELAAGTPAEEVLSRRGSGLPGYVRGLVRAGICSGQLGQSLEEFLMAIRRRRTASHGFWIAMMYPVILLPASILAASAIVWMIVPQFKNLFNDFGVELPWLTAVLVGLGDLLSPSVLLVLFLAIPVLLLLLRVLPYCIGPALWTRFIQRLPIIGTPSRMRGMSEFCSFVGLLISGSIPLHEALSVAGATLHDPNLRAGTLKLAKRVEAGIPMSDAAAQLPHFSHELRSLFRWENRGTAFGDFLRQAAEVYANRSQVQLGLVAMVFQPLMLTLVGGVLALVVIALFLPLITLLNALT